jgi:thiol-disulfide isomerase/thioredoxin
VSKPNTPRRSKGSRRRAATQAPRRRIVTIGGVVAAVAVLVGVVIANGNSDAPPATEAGDGTQDLALEMLDGSTRSLDDYRGEPLVVNFFASWCAPCLAEMPGFESVSQSLDGQVTFLGVNLQDRPDDGRRVVEQTGVTYDVARDPDGSIFEQFGAVAMPTTVFIDAQGNVADLQSGEISASALADRIEETLLS